MQANAGAILDIRVTDGPSLLFLHYDHRDVADHPLGYIVENRFIRRALHAAEIAGGHGRQGRDVLRQVRAEEGLRRATASG